MSPPVSDPNTTPALKPPKGVTPNLIDPASQGYICIIVMIVYLVVTTPFVVIRVYTRRYINKRVWWDDCKLSLALALAFDELTCPEIHLSLLGYATIHFSMKIKWDKDLTVPQCGLVGLTAIIFDALNYGIGKDMWNVSVADAARFSEVGDWSE